MASLSPTNYPASWIAATNLASLNPNSVAYMDGTVALVDQPCTLVGYQLSCRFAGTFATGFDNSTGASYFTNVSYGTDAVTFSTTSLRLRLENMPSANAAGDALPNQKIVWFDGDGVYCEKLYIVSGAGATGIAGTPGLTVTAFYKLQPTA